MSTLLNMTERNANHIIPRGSIGSCHRFLNSFIITNMYLLTEIFIKIIICNKILHLDVLYQHLAELLIDFINFTLCDKANLNTFKIAQ